jgi:hypothetical protein
MNWKIGEFVWVNGVPGIVLGTLGGITVGTSNCVYKNVPANQLQSHSGAMSSQIKKKLIEKLDVNPYDIVGNAVKRGLV